MVVGKGRDEDGGICGGRGCDLEGEGAGNGGGGCEWRRKWS